MKQLWDGYKVKSKLENDARAAEMGCPFKEVTHPMDEPAVVSVLQRLAAQKRTALIDFVWPSNVRAKVYWVEPYALMAGSYDRRGISLVCRGCRARTGWQRYVLRGIVGVADGGSEFVPRRSITLPTGKIEPYSQETIEFIVTVGGITEP
jgi:hypothetical protein